MARNMYGATSADFTITSGGRVVPGAVLTLWTARTGGTQITDLLDVDSVACTTVTSAADGSVVYYGPNNDKTVHWADSGQGSRIAIRPVDITGDPPVMSIGTVGTGTAAASLTGTSEAPVLNLTLPSAGTDGVNTAAIQDSAVTTAKLADAAVTSAKLSAGLGGLLTTKGDMVVRDGSTAVRLPVGADGTVLQADAGSAAGVRWGTPTTRVGSGSPLNIVVPDFKGQEFVDTAQTLGARKWVATSTLASGWVVSDGETPWYDLQPILANGWASASAGHWFGARRRPGWIDFHAVALTPVSATSTTVMTLPANWRPREPLNFIVVGGDAVAPVRMSITSAGVVTVPIAPTTADYVRWSIQIPTDGPWPTSAPV